MALKILIVCSKLVVLIDSIYNSIKCLPGGRRRGAVELRNEVCSTYEITRVTEMVAPWLGSSDTPAFESQFHCFLVVWPWVTQLKLPFNFSNVLIYREALWWGINLKLPKAQAQSLALSKQSIHVILAVSAATVGGPERLGNVELPYLQTQRPWICL